MQNYYNIEPHSHRCLTKTLLHLLYCFTCEQAAHKTSAEVTASRNEVKCADVNCRHVLEPIAVETLESLPCRAVASF